MRPFSVAVTFVASLLLAACGARSVLETDRGLTPQPSVGSAAASSADFSSACVAADHPIASRAGALMLAKGGNAIDAAVAASFTLSVVRPFSCGIGGGGFMIIHLAPDDQNPSPRDIALNYRETTPGAIDPHFYERHPDPDASTRGACAAAVPGTVAGLLDALQRFGTLDRATVLAPAIAAAEEGFAVDNAYRTAAHTLIRRFSEHPERKTRFAFLWNRFLNRGSIELGHTIRNPEQAAALRLIARDGADAFYRGPIADAIIAAVRADRGVMTHADLDTYTPAYVQPLRFTAFNLTFLVMPPPSSGGIAMAQTLGLLERLRRPTHTEADRLHLLAESFQHAFADRAHYLADPDFAPVPVEELLSPATLDRLAARVSLARTAIAPTFYGSRNDIPLPDAPPDDAGTSHLSVVDAHGNAVACTETINLEFGSLLAVPEYGFCLNNEMDDFLTRRGEPNAFGLTQSDRNLPAPGKRPLSSMSPTIVLDASDSPIAVAGASGGPRIITATTQSLLNALVSNQNGGDAVAAPRLHHQWLPPTLEYEAAFADRPGAAAIIDNLRARGHTLGRATSNASVQLIRRAPNARGWQAASDPRKGGTPAGY